MLNKYFVNWFFQIVWVLDFNGVRLKDLPHIAFEIDNKKADPDAKTYYVDYIVEVDGEEGVLVKLQDQVHH